MEKDCAILEEFFQQIILDMKVIVCVNHGIGCMLYIFMLYDVDTKASACVLSSRYAMLCYAMLIG